MTTANKRAVACVLQDTLCPTGSQPDHDRVRRGAALVEALGLVRAQRRRARGRRRLVFSSADDGAHWVALLDSTGRMADRRITRNVARFGACADGRWPADALILPGDTPDTLAARVLIAEHQLYPRVLANLVNGRS